jgi:hypothetical protein
MSNWKVAEALMVSRSYMRVFIPAGRPIQRISQGQLPPADLMEPPIPRAISTRSLFITSTNGRERPNSLPQGYAEQPRLFSACLMQLKPGILLLPDFFDGAKLAKLNG